MAEKASLSETAKGQSSNWTRALLIAVAATAAAYLLLIELSYLLAVTFTATLIAVALASLVRLFKPRSRLKYVVVLALILLVLLLLTAALFWWVGPQFVAQLDRLEEQVRLGIRRVQEWYAHSDIGQSIRRRMPDVDSMAPEGATLLRRTGAILGVGFGIVSGAILVFFVGVLIAAHPEPYQRGFLYLFPRGRRERLEEVLSAIARSLRLWLLSRLLLMVLVGVLFGVGLWVLGVELALPLAVIAGLLNFIPYMGPILASIPALAVALLDGPKQALMVGGLYLVVQIVESYFAEPLIEARAISLPPALLVLFQVLCGVWLGGFGILIATPLLVVLVVSVQMLYVQDVLGEPIRVAGQK